MEVLLENKNAVIYGGVGKVGGAVAREGAKAFLAGRTREPLGAVAADVMVVGGVPKAKMVDSEPVERHGLTKRSL
ncbi:MAG: hypothetical protein M3305_04885 [Actinomycetota bacterium]|nr:hypothetical protein [Actinomycetota bacterium]